MKIVIFIVNTIVSNWLIKVYFLFAYYIAKVIMILSKSSGFLIGMKNWQVGQTTSPGPEFLYSYESIDFSEKRGRSLM